MLFFQNFLKRGDNFYNIICTNTDIKQEHDTHFTSLMYQVCIDLFQIILDRPQFFQQNCPAGLFEVESKKCKILHSMEQSAVARG